jgi:SAM-dependent methyltransferase
MIDATTPAKRALHRLRGQLNSVLYRGSEVFCPICENSLRRFLDAGYPTRAGVKCPACFSLERHRMIWLFLQRKTNLFDGAPKGMLHIAPEIALGRRLRRVPGLEYLSGDLDSPEAMMKVDITDLPFEDGHFEVIYCSHVLEHVPDDITAMQEFYRVMLPGGWAILQVPITAEITFEDLSVTDPAERLRLFGQHNHVRRYGLDYMDRLKSVGFSVDLVPVTAFATQAEIRRMRVFGQQGVFYCRKPIA